MKIIVPAGLAAPHKEYRHVEAFRHFAHQASRAAGSPWAFALGVAIVVAWGAMGRIFEYSETWQLVINTGTTIVTFLMVFLIQNTQARDSKELHIKLDELIRAVDSARNTIINCDNLSDDELERIEEEIRRAATEEPPRMKQRS
jgi:low affinity Fe/Cu permease